MALHPNEDWSRLGAAASAAPPLASAALAPALREMQPRALTGAEMRRVGELLTAQFDEEKGAFAPGWDDERIAIAIDVPRASVVKLREEGWGKLKVFSDLEGLKSEAATLRRMIVELETRILAVEKARR